MKFSLGSIVKGQNNETLIILATKEFALTSKNLKNLNGILYIIGVDILARTEIHVIQGFDYVVGQIQSFEGKYCVLNHKFKFKSVFEEDLIQ